MPTALRVETVVLPGHRLEIIAPGFPDGTAVEVTVLPLTPGPGSSSNPEWEAVRLKALDRILKRSQASKFRSDGPYPTRDELHERA